VKADRKAMHLTNLLINASHNRLSIKLNSEAEEKTNLRIMNTWGQLIINKTVVLKKGLNVFIEDITALPYESYVIVLSNKQFKASKKFIKRYNP
jgi:hypothetical protein